MSILLLDLQFSTWSNVVSVFYQDIVHDPQDDSTSVDGTRPVHHVSSDW